MKLFPSTNAILLCLAAAVRLAVAGPGDVLKSSMIWYPDTTVKAVAFHKTFSASATSGPATLFIFADTRYVLWINGKYVVRGPNRFDPKRVEYDSLDIRPYLAAGRNAIAVLVYGHIAGNGHAMYHTPGLALLLQGNGINLGTDTSWRCSNNTRFRAPRVNWADVQDRVDASLETGDFTSADFIDSSWTKAKPMSGNLWGKFVHRMTPMLASAEVPVSGFTLPVEAKAGETIVIKVPRNVTVQAALEFDADPGSRMVIGDRHIYTARAGRQSYITCDAFGTGEARNVDSVSTTIRVESGRFVFQSIKLLNAIYPFKVEGSFSSNDSLLNRYWQVMMNSLTQLAEDGYEDCPWERAEWMGGMDHVFDATRIALTGPGPGGAPVYGDPRLMAKMIMDIGQSAQPDGRVKAHHPSDRWDIHGYIEDYSCVWIWDIKQHYDITGDAGFVAELWPAVKAQVKWFLDRITAHGLVNAREFFIFDNPYAYKTCEGATLNAFLFKALNAAADLASLMNEPSTAATYRTAANTLKAGFNTYLWDAQAGTFKGAVDSNITLHAAVTALYSGVCSNDHLAATRAWLSKQGLANVRYPWIFNYWFRCLYGMDSDNADLQVLNAIRSKFDNPWNAKNPGYVTSEANNGGRNFHTYGIVPAYFFGAYLLGVRIEEPARNKRILIEPRLGDLTSAHGNVVSELGMVPVSWERKPDTTLDFSFSVPTGSTARVGIPLIVKDPTLVLDGEVWIRKGISTKAGVSIGERFVYLDTVAQGPHRGLLQPGYRVVSAERPARRSPADRQWAVRYLGSAGEGPARISITAPAGWEDFAVDLYDMKGSRIRSLAFKLADPDTRTVAFDCRDPFGRPLRAGSYGLRLRGTGLDKTVRVTVGEK